MTAKPEILATEMTCTQLREEIKTTNEKLTALDKKANDQNGGGVRTGGVIGAQGGYSSGVNLGVGLSIGTTFNNYSRHRARLDAEDVRERMNGLQNEVIKKRCDT